MSGWCAVSLVIGTYAQPGEAQPSGPLTLEGAVREVLAWHPAVTQAAASVSAREEEVKVARAGYAPRITGGVGTGYDSRLGSSWRPRPQVSASQILYDFGKVGSTIEAARAGTKVGRADLLISVDELIRDTGYALVEVQRNAALHDIAMAQLASIQQISDLVGERFHKGASTQSDALQAQSRVAAAQAMLSQIEAEQRRWSSNLAFLLGRDAAPDVDRDVPEWLMRSCAAPPPDWTQVPAVMRAEARREQATAELRRSRAERYPTLSLAGDAATDVTSPLSRRSLYSVGLNVSSTLFNGGAVQARARGASFALASAEAAARQARMETNQRLAEAQQQIASLEELLETLVSRKGDMIQTGKLYRLQYLEMGTRSLVDLLNAEQELHQTAFDAANTVHDLRRLQIDCLHSSGRARTAFKLDGTKLDGVTL